MATNRTPFESEAERIIVNYTDRMFADLSMAANKHGIDDKAVERTIQHFAGGDTADAWFNYCADAEE